MVRILGGGPAGTAAAIAALAEGAQVELYEPSQPPRNKVSGEFLSPEALPLLESLGVLGECVRARPAHVSRLIVHSRRSEKCYTLPEPAWGLSRCRLDGILLDRAAALGCRIVGEQRAEAQADVIASGRPQLVDRLGIDCPIADALLRKALPGSKIGYDSIFGFKAHFRGSFHDAVELHFFQFGWVELNPVEDGLVSVCGLAHGHLLREHGFEPDALLASRPAMAERIRPLSRTTDWLTAGPLGESDDITWRRTGPYRAGDALGTFPAFTISGVPNALLSGSVAGRAAARAMPAAEYFREAEKVLGRRYLIASAISAAIDTGWAALLAPVLPIGWMYRHTRPPRAGTLRTAG